MARKKLVPKYTGPLAEPIYEPFRGIFDSIKFGDKSPEDENDDKVGAQWAKKLLALLELFDIDHNDEKCWLYLSLQLAVEHVPGFQVHSGNPPKRGRKRIWKAGAGNHLVRTVHTVMQETGKCQRDAIRKMINDDRLRKSWGRFSVETLEARCRDAKREQARYQKRFATLLAPRPMVSLNGLAQDTADSPLMKLMSASHQSAKSTRVPNDEN